MPTSSSLRRINAVLDVFDSQQDGEPLRVAQLAELLRHVASFYGGYTISEREYNEKRGEILDLLDRELPSSYRLKEDLAPAEPTWANALRAAGLIPCYISNRLTKEREETSLALLDEILRLDTARRASARVTQPGRLTTRAYDAGRRAGTPPAGYARKLFGSWEEAVDEALVFGITLH